MKSLDEIIEPDERQAIFSRSLETLHAELEEIALIDRVPAKVSEVFDTARNLALYSWFAPEFHAVADLVGFAALEGALRARAAQEGEQVEKKTLRPLIKHALEAGWIDEQGLADREGIARGRLVHSNAIKAIEEMKRTGASEISLPEPTAAEILEEASSMNVVELICNAAVKLRNSLAHGSLPLDMGNYRHLRRTAGLINQLFP